MLKTIVIVLGALLVAGFIVLAVTIVKRVGALEQAGGAKVVNLALPKEAAVGALAVGPRLLAVHTTSPSGERILIVNLESGAVVREIAITRD